MSRGGKLYVAGRTASLINYVELPTEFNVLDVSEQKLSADGRRIISLVDDGAGIKVHSVTAAGVDPPLAEVSRPRPYWYPENGYRLSGRIMPIQRTGKRL